MLTVQGILNGTVENEFETESIFCSKTDFPIPTQLSSLNSKTQNLKQDCLSWKAECLKLFKNCPTSTENNSESVYLSLTLLDIFLLLLAFNLTYILIKRFSAWFRKRERLPKLFNGWHFWQRFLDYLFLRIDGQKLY